MSKYYKGISFPFRFSPAGGVAVSDSSLKSKFQHIKESIIQIILTELGERVMQPEFGCELQELLFEPLDSSLVNIIKYRVQNAIERWEDRVEILDITVLKSSEDSIVLQIDFEVVEYKVKDSVQVVKVA
jgi:phage baseplate assembly protein W